VLIGQSLRDATSDRDDQVDTCEQPNLIQCLTCKFSGSYQVVMSSEMQKRAIKNKKDAHYERHFQNCFVNIETKVYVGNICCSLS